MSGYADLGLRPLINALGTVTAVGGSLMEPAVLDAMREAAGSFVDLHELQRAAGERIAALFGVEAACVTSGAAAGLTLSAAACLSLKTPGHRDQLPVTTGMADQCLMLRGHHNSYDRAVTMAGACVVDVDASDATLDELRRAITDETALLLYMAEAEHAPGSLPLRDVAETLHAHGRPVVVDAAAEIPPRDRITRYLADGADLVIVSGGKQIRGPQSSGLILGTRRYVAECAALGFPHHGLGRAMKTDKETIVGLVTAVELFVARDESADFARWEEMVAHLLRGLAGCQAVRARRHLPVGPGIQPTTIPRVYLAPLGLSAAQVRDRLRAGDPAIVVGVDGDEVVLNPQCLRDDELDPVVRAVVAVCAGA